MRRVLVTGSASGIGQALVKALASKTCQVYAGVRKESDLVVFDQHPNVQPILLDVCNVEHIQSVKARFEADGGLDVLINNAGVSGGGPVEALDVDELQRLFDVNVFGVVRITQACIPLLRRSQGRVINMGSISGRVALPFLTPYSSSKFALEALTDGLRREVSSQGIRVVMVSPGSVKTQIWQKSVDYLTRVERRLNDRGLGHYLPKIKVLDSKLRYNIQHAESPDVVIRGVIKAMNSARPKPRYFVGKGVKKQALLSRYLPDGALDRLFANWLK